LQFSILHFQFPVVVTGFHRGIELFGQHVFQTSEVTGVGCVGLIIVEGPTM